MRSIACFLANYLLTTLVAYLNECFTRVVSPSDRACLFIVKVHGRQPKRYARPPPNRTALLVQSSASVLRVSLSTYRNRV